MLQILNVQYQYHTEILQNTSIKIYVGIVPEFLNIIKYRYIQCRHKFGNEMILVFNPWYRLTHL